MCVSPTLFDRLHPANDRKHAITNVDTLLNKPPPLIGIIIGFLTLRVLQGGGLLIMGAHYTTVIPRL